MSNINCTRRLEFDAAHRVPGHEGKCKMLHGHRYAVEITVDGDVHDDGMILDFGLIKERVGTWIDANLDHTTILWAEDPLYIPLLEIFREAELPREVFRMNEPPTAENIATMLLDKSRELLTPFHINVVVVRVYETPNCWSDAHLLVGGEVISPVDWQPR